MSKEIIEKLKQEEKFDEFLAEELKRSVPNPTKAELKNLIQAVKEHVNPSMMDPIQKRY